MKFTIYIVDSESLFNGVESGGIPLNALHSFVVDASDEHEARSEANATMECEEFYDRFWIYKIIPNGV